MDASRLSALKATQAVLHGAVAAPGRDFTVRQMAALLALHLDGEAYQVSTLARRIGVSTQAAVRLLDVLCAQGLVRRLPCTDDRRRVLLATTDLSFALVAGLAAAAPESGR